MPDAIGAAARAWPMSFSSLHFVFFLPLCAGAYFLLPGRLRRAWLLLCSYWFYFFAAPRYLPVLLLGTLASWAGGLWASGRKTQRARRGCMLAAVGFLLLILAFFKVNGFFAVFLSPLFAALGASYSGGLFTTAAALGISFYTFTAAGYLIDVYRGDVAAEKNLLNYALFLGFFPSVAMGPINRAGVLLPQLKDTARRFSPAGAADSLRTMAIGLFKKLAVADTLAVFTGAVYGNLPAYSGLTLTAAALCFALQLYFDFSGYTDIARGAAKLLGIHLPQNFQNPYYATNFSQFWQRWHISLSCWLQDYIFTPLVWSRWPEKLPLLRRFAKKPPVLSSIAAVFVVSGVWHGDTLCFLVWGALMALYRIGEELLHRVLGKPKKHPGLAARIGKTAVVLVLWVEGLVFFKVGMAHGGTVADALSALGRQFVPGGSLAADVFGAVQSGFYQDSRIAMLFIAFMAFCLALALWADWAQCHRLKGGSLAAGVAGLPAAAKWLVYFVLAVCCFAGFVLQSGGFSGTSFLYGGF